MSTETRRFSVGDRVAIIAPGHPWRGHSGVITAPFTAAGLDWSVRLDRGDYPGHESAVAESELRPERRSAGSRP